jgi:hypothetical protein
MIRSSSAYSICTNRPNFDEGAYFQILEKVKTKVQKKKETFSLAKIDDYCMTPGIATDAKSLKSQMTQKYNAEHDPLPDGAKTYLEERWLELNYSFYDFSIGDGLFKIMKGNLCEDGAIELLAKYYKMSFEKNGTRMSLDFLTGEADIIVSSQEIVRDVKVPETWKTFKKKKGIPLQYHWQLIAYCLLYNCTSAYLDYVLMPIPEEMLNTYAKNFSEKEMLRFEKEQKSINNLPIEYRIKTYKLQGDIQEDIMFLESRLKKAKEYYDSLTFSKCMKLPTHGY